MFGCLADLSETPTTHEALSRVVFASREHRCPSRTTESVLSKSTEDIEMRVFAETVHDVEAISGYVQ